MTKQSSNEEQASNHNVNIGLQGITEKKKFKQITSSYEGHDNSAVSTAP